MISIDIFDGVSIDIFDPAARDKDPDASKVARLLRAIANRVEQGEGFDRYPIYHTRAGKRVGWGVRFNRA